MYQNLARSFKLKKIRNAIDICLHLRRLYMVLLIHLDYNLKDLEGWGRHVLLILHVYYLHYLHDNVM